jgi:hypothetical protein
MAVPRCGPTDADNEKLSPELVSGAAAMGSISAGTSEARGPVRHVGSAIPDGSLRQLTGPPCAINGPEHLEALTEGISILNDRSLLASRLS